MDKNTRPLEEKPNTSGIKKQPKTKEQPATKNWAQPNHPKMHKPTNSKGVREKIN